MTLAYAVQLGLIVQKTDVNAQKIDKSSLETYCSVIATFHNLDKLGYSYFLKKTFLLSEIGIKVVLDMPLLIFSNTDV